MNTRSLQVSPFERPRVEVRKVLARHAPLAREVLWCVALLAGWLALWMKGAETLPEPWAPDPETRAALVEVLRDAELRTTAPRAGLPAP